MNRATEMMAENTYYQYFDTMVIPTPECAQDFWKRMVEDFCDEYDVDWFALIATPAISKTLDWEAICDYAIKKMKDDYSKEEWPELYAEAD